MGESGSLTFPTIEPGMTLDKADAIKDSGFPDMTSMLLLRSGDVELNPGPSGTAGNLTELELYLLAECMDPSHFRKVGLALGFSEAELSRCEKDQGNTMQATYQMLYGWRKKARDSEARSILVNTLENIQLKQLAFQLRKGHIDDDIPSLTEEEIERVAEDVKRYFRIELCQIQADPLNSEFLLQFERIFTNLTLMEEERGTTHKTPLLYCDLLKTKVNGVYPKRLLVEGEGGVGKTTLCAKIAWDWIHGQGYQDFKLVLVILLRKAKGKTVGEIVKSYLSDNNPVTAKQLDKYILTHPEDVFLVLDGLDEFAVDLTSIQQFTQVIANRLFKSGTVLITSRQWRSDEIRKNTELRKAFAFVSVEGFSDENLAAYISKFFSPDKVSSEELSRFITDNDVIRENMAPFPIYTAMLCVMWKEFDGERREAICKLQTFSKLFDEMINFLVDHYVAKDVAFSADASLSELHSDALRHLTLIGRIAFQCLTERKLVFSEDEFQNCLESMEMGCKVGVLTRKTHTPKMRERRKNFKPAVPMVQFPHKLFQEYLSGMYLASLFASERSEYDRLTTELFESNTMEYRYLLYFTSAQQKEVALDIISRLLAKKGTTYRKRYDNFIVDVAYESQDQEVAKAVADILMTTSNTLKITTEMHAHTVSGHLFVMEHRGVEELSIVKSCGRTVSEDLAEFMCTSRTLRSVTIDEGLDDIFYSMLAEKAVDSKIQAIEIQSVNLKERSSASSGLAQFVCMLPRLKNVTLGDKSDIEVSLHDDFYKTLSSMGSSAKIETLIIRNVNLRGRPTAAHHLGQFVCQMPRLKKLTLVGQYESGSSLDDKYHSTSGSMASSAKVETLRIIYGSLTGRPSGAHGLAQFIFKAPRLKHLILYRTFLHDGFFSTPSSASAAEKDDGQDDNTSASLTEITLDEFTLENWKQCETIFGNVKMVTLQVKQTIKSDVIQRIQLPGATDLTIETDENEYQPARFDEDPTILYNAILNVFPQLVRVTFSDLNIGNSGIEPILQAFSAIKGVRHLSIRFIRCLTDESVDDVINSFNEDPITEVAMEHGEPRGEYFGE